MFLCSCAVLFNLAFLPNLRSLLLPAQHNYVSSGTIDDYTLDHGDGPGDLIVRALAYLKRSGDQSNITANETKDSVQL